MNKTCDGLKGSAFGGPQVEPIQSELRTQVYSVQAYTYPESCHDSSVPQERAGHEGISFPCRHVGRDSTVGHHVLCPALRQARFRSAMVIREEQVVNLCPACAKSGKKGGGGGSRGSFVSGFSREPFTGWWANSTRTHVNIQAPPHRSNVDAIKRGIPYQGCFGAVLDRCTVVHQRSQEGRQAESSKVLIPK